MSNGNHRSHRQASSSSTSPSSSSILISPNHPDELKKQPLPEYDPRFTIKSYLVAAQNLLEKAKSNDAGGQLENAFVNYRKAAAIIAFCGHAKELQAHQTKGDDVWKTFKTLQQSVIEIVARCKRIEDLLIERENKTVLSLKDRSNDTSINSTSTTTTTTTTKAEDELKSPPLSPSNSRKSHQDDSHLISANPNQPNSLAARLASLRNSGIDSGTTSAGNKRMSRNGFNPTIGEGNQNHDFIKDTSPQKHQNGFEIEDRNGIQEEENDNDNEEERRKQLENLRIISASPELSSKHDNFSLHKISESLRRDVAQGRDVVGESGYSRGDETPEYNPQHRQNDENINGEDGRNSVDSQDDENRNQFGHIPTASEFNSQYPTLDDFEKDEDSRIQSTSLSSSNQFPSIPTHSVGGRNGASRPLPNPPVRPDNSDFNLVRDVPQGFDLKDPSFASSFSTSSSPQTSAATNHQTSSTSTSHSEINRSHRTSRPAPPIPTSSKPSFIPSSSRAAKSSSATTMTPMPGSGMGEIGTKPRAPTNPYITSNELYKYLYPGFENLEVEPGVTQLASRVGLEILLLDVRNRAEFERGRIKAKNSVCLEPLILKEGISCEEIEDKILISPYDEQINWSRRGEVDLVVIYDEESRKFDQDSSRTCNPKEALDIERINILYSSLTERNHSSPLKNKPVILIGGMESWSRNLGEPCITRSKREIGDASVNYDSSNNGHNDPVNGSYASPSSTDPPRAENSNGGRTRFSTAYDRGINFGFGGPKESPDSRSSLDISRISYSNSSSSDEAKKARRQVHIGPNGINDLTQGFSSSSSSSMPNPHFSNTSSLPNALIPARSPLPTSNGFNNSTSFSNLGTGLSMPARAYQSGGASPSPSHSHSASNTLGTPSSRVRASDDYFQQPHELYGSSSNTSRPTSSRQNSLSNPNFDYPTLASPSSSSSKPNSYQTPQQPISHHSHSHSNSISSNHQHHQSLSHPAPLPTAAVANGISARAPHQSSTASPSPSSGTRSPIPPTSNQSNSMSYPSTSTTDLSKRPAPTQSLSSIPNRGYYGQVGHIDQQIHIGMTGLKNVGNSCYMNSTLQCLSASLPLANFMLSRKYKDAINKVNPLGTQGALANAFAGLINVLWSEQYTFVSPVTFREAITKFAPSFRGYDQHDSQEFLVFLLDGLHEDLNYVVNKPPPVEVTKEREMLLETLPQQIASVQEWEIYRRRNNSIIVDQFQGQFRNKMTCLTCGTTSTTYNAFVNLSLPIPHGKGVTRATLQQCLDAFVKEEVMDKADAWNCPKCKRPRKATKRLSISRLPKLLVIHLKRFSFKGPFTDKIETKVDFPKQGLDLTNYMPPPLPPGVVKGNTPISLSQQPPYIYDLYAVTHHFGSLNTGHYTATIRNDGAWWYYDDSVVSKKDERHLNTNSPYVLWFRRRMG